MGTSLVTWIGSVQVGQHREYPILLLTRKVVYSLLWRHPCWAGIRQMGSPSSYAGGNLLLPGILRLY